MNNLTENNNDTEEIFPKDDASLEINYTFSRKEETVGKIPLFAENFEVVKKTEESNVTLTKNWITSTKTIDMHIKYEDVYINDRV